MKRRTRVARSRSKSKAATAVLEVPAADFAYYDGYLKSKFPSRTAKVQDMSDDENHSGAGKGAPIPPEIKGWNWGAFFLNWIWAIGHRAWIGLLALVPVPFLGLGIAIYLGVKGNELAWQNKRWDGIDQFRRTQRRWRTAGIIVLIVSTALVAALVVAAVMSDPEVTGNRNETRLLTSTDGAISLTVPGNWTEELALNDDAALQAGNRFEEMYVIAITDAKAELPPDVGLDQYAQVTRDNLLASIPEGRVTAAPQELQLGGMRAIRSEVSGAVDGHDVVYVVEAFETPTHYVQLMAWTLAERFADNRPTLIRVIETFKAASPA